MRIPCCQFLTALLIVALFSIHARGQSEELWLEIQGEYVGDVDNNGEQIRGAVNLVALGEDKFQLTVYRRGLPGDGWKSEDRRMTTDPVEMKDGKLVFEKLGQKLVCEDGVVKFYDAEGVFQGELNRVERKSETLGKEPPADAIVLFDGSTGKNFEAQDGGDPVVDGLLRQGVISKQKFAGDFELHIEFKLPFEPAKSGQARGNSGIYLQGRYEVQMLDSFGLTGEQNECGGIYSIKKPDVNMCYPPESWQTYDIVFSSAKWDGDEKTANARMTVHHNGVLIHDDVEVPNTTTAAPIKESAEAGYIYLQNHGSPVRYRNIWVAEK